MSYGSNERWDPHFSRDESMCESTLRAVEHFLELGFAIRFLRLSRHRPRRMLRLARYRCSR